MTKERSSLLHNMSGASRSTARVVPTRWDPPIKGAKTRLNYGAVISLRQIEKNRKPDFGFGRVTPLRQIVDVTNCKTLPNFREPMSSQGIFGEGGRDWLPIDYQRFYARLKLFLTQSSESANQLKKTLASLKLQDIEDKTDEEWLRAVANAVIQDLELVGCAILKNRCKQNSKTVLLHDPVLAFAILSKSSERLFVASKTPNLSVNLLDRELITFDPRIVALVGGVR